MSDRYFEARMIEGFDGYTFEDLCQMGERKFRAVFSRFVDSRWNADGEGPTDV